MPQSIAQKFVSWLKFYGKPSANPAKVRSFNLEVDKATAINGAKTITTIQIKLL